MLDYRTALAVHDFVCGTRLGGCVVHSQLYRAGGSAIVVLIAAGGVIYTLGAVVYALKKPDPLPRWFGFHEIFHACTVAAWVCQCIACYMAVLG